MMGRGTLSYGQPCCASSSSRSATSEHEVGRGTRAVRRCWIGFLLAREYYVVPSQKIISIRVRASSLEL